jgi:suppressor of ftsI
MRQNATCTGNPFLLFIFRAWRSMLVYFVVTIVFVDVVNGQVETLLRVFDWENKKCSDYTFGSDYFKCGVLEFCKLPEVGPTGLEQYGYRQPGAIGPNGICSSPGPTFRVQPGKKYLLSLKNAVKNSITNIHTHGAHLSGDGNADNILRIAKTGQCIHYSWDIPANHMGGTHWYHSHKHESSFKQTHGGAMGLFIVEDIPAALIPQSIALADPDTSASITQFLLNDKVIMGTNVQEKFRGNGRLGGAPITILKNDWTRLRVGVSDPIQGAGRNSQLLDLQFGQKKCNEAYVIAYDGVYRLEIPTSTVTLPTFIAGSGRVDIAIRCNETGTVTLNWGSDVIGILNIIEPTAIKPVIPDPFAYTITFNDTTNETFIEPTSWKPERPFYGRDLSNFTLAELNNTYDIVAANNLSINNIFWDAKVPLRTDELNEVNEWTIIGTNPHPMHLHVYHFQVMSPACGNHEQYQFYDTIISSNPCIVRFPFNDFSGFTTIHCHDLTHEDGTTNENKVSLTCDWLLFYLTLKFSSTCLCPLYNTPVACCMTS